MDNYKRFLTYINSYTRGELIRNVGSSKIELRGEDCRISVNAKGLMDIGIEHVFLFKRDSNEMEVTYLGKLIYSNGNYELRVETNRNNMLDTGIGFDDFGGILLLKDKNMDTIEKPQQLYAGIWDNKPIGNVIRKVPKITSSSKSPIHKKTLIPDNVNDEEEMVFIKEEEQKFVELAKVVEHINSRNTTEKIIGNISNNKVEEVILAASTTNPELNQCEDENVDCMEVRFAMANSMREKFKEPVPVVKEKSVIEQKVEKILEIYPKMDPFADESECVRIEPVDVVDVPVSIWMLVNNIFLKDAYKKFKHLILAKNGDAYVFGVPGVKSEKEQFMAYLHGFSEFKPIRKLENITENFGYWLVKINV